MTSDVPSWTEIILFSLHEMEERPDCTEAHSELCRLSLDTSGQLLLKIWLFCSTCSVDRFSSSLLLITAKLGFPVEW